MGDTAGAVPHKSSESWSRTFYIKINIHGLLSTMIHKRLSYQSSKTVEVWGIVVYLGLLLNWPALSEARAAVLHWY